MMRALTHLPSPHMDHGQRTHVARIGIDYERAVQQHRGYCQALQACGVTVHTLDVNQALPDSTFVEDTALMLDELAVIASMGTEARRGELAGIEAELRKYRPVRRIDANAPLEGGDILRIGRKLLIGVSSRTAHAGVEALTAIVEPHGYQVKPVTVRGCLHLKTACTAMSDGSLLLNPQWLDCGPLREFSQIPVPDAEPWAANTLTVGGTVLIAAEHVRTAEQLRQRGYEVRTVPLSEFMKAEGGVTCLAILFRESVPSAAS